MRTSRRQCRNTEDWKIHMQVSKPQQKGRPTEYQSDEPPKVKILFYSLTRIDGVCKRTSMNDTDQEES